MQLLWNELLQKSYTKQKRSINNAYLICFISFCYEYWIIIEMGSFHFLKFYFDIIIWHISNSGCSFAWLEK